jgi:WD40 repeat protein
LAADIWNSIWSPCGKYFATCSEDRNAKIFKLEKNEFQEIQTLTGHVLACTDIDWYNSK